jgi:sugar phosphate isomerase/epimerase
VAEAGGGAATAVQLSTIRPDLARDLDRALGRLAGLGVAAVEPCLDMTAPAPLLRIIEAALPGWRPLGIPAPLLRARLDAHGLGVTSTHAYLPEPGRLPQVLEEQAVLGSRLMVVPLLSDPGTGAVERMTELAGVQRAAERLNVAAAVARSFGMSLGYHNHPWDVQNRIGDRTSLETLFALLDPGIVAEVDVYWVRFAGCDPAELIASLGSRVTHLHLKDGHGGTVDRSCALGAGSVNVDAILAAAPHARWRILELDNMGDDVWDVLRQSLRYLNARLADRSVA